MAISFNIKGFTGAPLGRAQAVTKCLGRSLIGSRNIRNLRTSEVEIVRIESESAPMYVSNSPNELIVVNCGENYPFQFTFQLAHELGHLSTASYLRYPRSDGNKWIEEAMCGAYSLIGLRSYASLGKKHEIGVSSYLSGDEMKNERAFVDVTQEWFEIQRSELSSTTTLTPNVRKISGLIDANLTSNQIISDNIAIADVPVGTDTQTFLNAWSVQCSGLNTTPKLLLGLWGQKEKIDEAAIEL
jgi:hypothetical protein